ncbi:MAG: hypothetical protein F9B45_24360 [Phycisphaera sp. RhM]|nr:hypothetical protein [Phycisphaera sp. RhM]
MHAIEQRMVDLLSSDVDTTMNNLGGLSGLLAAEAEISKSPLIPDFLEVLARDRDDRTSSERRALISRLILACTDGPSLHDIVNVLDQAIEPTGYEGGLLFNTYRKACENEELEPIGRAAMLDGCLRLTIGEPLRRFDLIAMLVRIKIDTDGEFARWLAKIIGIVHSHWPEPELRRRLEELQGYESAASEACFELGMSSLAGAISADDPGDANAALMQAEEFFRQASKNSMGKPDADLFLLCCRMLREFSTGELTDTAQELATKISVALTSLLAYHRSEEDPTWLVSRTAEVFLWQDMSDRLRALDNELVAPAWYEPAVVVGRYLLPVYRATRSLLRRQESGGIETLLQPRIIGAVAATPAFLHGIREWLRRSQDSQFAAAAAELIGKTSQFAAESKTRSIFMGKARRQSAQEVIKTLRLGAHTEALLASAVSDLFSTHLATMSDVEFSVILECLESVKEHPDYQQSADTRRLFNAMLFWTVHFARTRLDMTVKDEPAVKYLFRQPNGKKPLESALQLDYISLLRPFMAGTDVEVMNIGSGRADVCVSLAGERMITEVKREDRDCSFDSLNKAYSSQTFEYQNTASRLGFLLVLDQTDRDGKGIHLTDCIKPISVVPNGETVSRFVVVVKIPGERLNPSEQTKLSKSTRKRRINVNGKRAQSDK